MIAGETESILSRNTGLDHYDNFLFFGKKKKGKSTSVKRGKKVKSVKKELSPEEQEEREARRARRQQFWSNLGANINSSLKEGGTVSNVVEMFKGGKTEQPEPQDYQVNLGEQDNLSSYEQEEEDKEKKENSIPIPALIVGGVLILAIGYLAYQNYQSSQESKRLQS